MKRILFSSSLWVSLLLLSLFSCDNPNITSAKIPSDCCVELNNKAMQKYWDESDVAAPDSIRNVVIRMLDDAIVCDSLCSSALHNKYNFLREKGDYLDCINVMKQLSRNANQQDPMFDFNLAECYHALGDTLNFNLYKNRSHEKLEFLKVKSDLTFLDILTISSVLATFKGQEEAQLFVATKNSFLTMNEVSRIKEMLLKVKKLE